MPERKGDRAFAGGFLLFAPRVTIKEPINKGMDVTTPPPSARPGASAESYRTLGKKTLWIFTMARIHATIVLLLVAVALFATSSTGFVSAGPFGDMHGLVMSVAWIALALFVVVGLITFFASWLIYVHYKFFLGEDSLKIKRGILDKEEIAIPYRQIQDVDIERDLMFQMMGLSRLIILTAGHEDEKPSEDESEGVLPGMDKDLAEWLQGQLLKRANVQKVVETNAASNAAPGGAK